MAINLIEGTSGADTLSGTESDDLIVGLAGNDTLVVQSQMPLGIDTLNGGQGNDTYVLTSLTGVVQFDSGFGSDTVQSVFTPIALSPHAFTFQLAPEYTSSKARLSLVDTGAVNGASWVLSFEGLPDQITFTQRPFDSYFSYIPVDAPGQVSVDLPDSIQFGDGVVWTRDEFIARTTTETLAQPGLVIKGGVGADVLTAPLGQGPHVLVGGAGNDTLVSSAASDMLRGGLGDDTYVFNAGWGTDIGRSIETNGNPYAQQQPPTSPRTYAVVNSAGPVRIINAPDVYNPAGVDAGFDVIRFGEGVTRSSVTFVEDGVHLRIRQQQGSDLLIEDYFNEVRGLKQGAGGIDDIQFADGSHVGLADILALRNWVVTGSEGSDSLGGSPLGDDTLLGLGGADTLRGGAGADVYDGGSGDDVYIDYAYVSGKGGGSNPYVPGGADTYRFGHGSGHDIVHDLGDTLSANADTLMFGDGVTPDDVLISLVDVAPLPGAGAFPSYSLGTGSMRVALKSTGDTFTISGGINLWDSSQGTGVIERFVFGDGTVWSWQDAVTRMVIPPKVVVPPDLNLTGTAGKDTLVGGDGHDTLSGGAGNDSLSGGKGRDQLFGGAGSDTLGGGLGDDRLFGNAGNDTYLFERGGGQDVILDSDGTWFNSDLLKVSGATSRQLWLTRSGSNLDISVIGTTDKVTIEGWYASSANRIEKITAVGDNKSLSYSKVNALVTAMAAFAPPAEGQTTLPTNVQTSLSKVLASSWV
jgi:Ca2+-binding RTX toxin-like protein